MTTSKELKVSPKMHDELMYAANTFQNAAGSVSYCPRRTEDALLRRGLITYDATVNNCPVITVKGWEYLASQGFERRSEDPGRLTLNEALDEAFPVTEVKPTVIGHDDMRDVIARMKHAALPAEGDTRTAELVEQMLRGRVPVTTVDRKTYRLGYQPRSANDREPWVIGLLRFPSCDVHTIEPC